MKKIIIEKVKSFVLNNPKKTIIGVIIILIVIGLICK